MPVAVWLVTVPLAIGILMLREPLSEMVHTFFAELTGTTSYDTDQAGRDA